MESAGAPTIYERQCQENAKIGLKETTHFMCTALNFDYNLTHEGRGTVRLSVTWCVDLTLLSVYFSMNCVGVIE